MKSAPVYMSLPPPCPVYFWEPRPTLPSSARVILLNFPSPTAIRSSVHISPPQLQPGPHIKLWPAECVQHLLPSPAQRSPQQVLVDPQVNDWPLLCGQHWLVSGA